MKDQYTGDINDYFKYSLLRASHGVFDSMLIAWMLTEADGRKDGGRIQYLKDLRSRQLDSDLFDALQSIVASGERKVSAIEEAQILGGCGFVSGPMPRGALDRAEYFRSLADQAGPDSLVFFDPDNGLEVPSVPRRRRGAERYLFWDELALFRDAGASVLIYQHFPRVQRQQYLRTLLVRLRREMGSGYDTFAAYSSHVAFLFAVGRQYADPLRTVIDNTCSSSQLLAIIDHPSAM